MKAYYEMKTKLDLKLVFIVARKYHQQYDKQMFLQNMKYSHSVYLPLRAIFQTHLGLLLALCCIMFLYYE